MVNDFTVLYVPFAPRRPVAVNALADQVIHLWVKAYSVLLAYLTKLCPEGERAVVHFLSQVERATMSNLLTRQWHSKASFLSLPTELRHAIYDQAIPVRRLCTTHFIDGEHDPEPQTIPPLFFVSHQVYSEAADVFYSKAMLAMPVPQLSSNLQDWAMGKALPDVSQAMTRHMSLSFLPQRLKNKIRTASLFNNEASCYPTPVAYEALLCWLVRNTGVTSISISKALMFRACKRRSIRDEEASALLGCASTRPQSMKTVKIFSRNDREFWEGRGMGAGRGTIVAEQAPSLRMFICIKDSGNTALICDPRGAPRVNRQNASEVEKVHGSTMGELMDSLRARDPCLEDAVVQRTDSDGRWLFQVIFVI